MQTRDLLTLYFGKNSYRATQFIIRIDAPIDIDRLDDGLERNPGQKAMYLHEYTHFLQDISTRYGLMKAGSIFAYASQVAHCIRLSSNPKFATPYILSPGKGVNQIIFQNSKNLHPYMGSGFEKKDTFKDRHIRVTSPRIVKRKYDGENYVESLILTLIDARDNKEIDDIVFGGEILCEGMAYLVECKFLDSKGIQRIPAQEYPYNITEFLTALVYPELSRNAEQMFKCIDAALYYTFNSGVSYYNLICHLKKAEFHKTWNYDLIRTFFSEQDRLIPFKDCTEESIRLLHHCFQIVQLNPTISWLEKLYKRVSFLRVLPDFMKCFIRNNPKELHFRSIVEGMLGRPIVQNDIYDAQFKVPANMFNIQEIMDIQVDKFSSIASLLNVFNGSKGCNMMDFCKASTKSDPHLKITNLCNTPWLKYTEIKSPFDHLCPFAFLWHHWGLDGKEPN